MILSGGRGERLHPLTADRAKPAVPFGGKYRIIDFTLSNCINSGLRSIIVLIQYKSHSLDRHIRRGWNVFNPEVGEYIFSLPPQQRISQDWYKGTADAVYQNWFIVEDKQPEFVLILAGDHIYKMNYKEMHSFLQQTQADVVVGAIEYPLTEASNFGVMTVDGNSRITRWDEKPAHPTPMPSDPTRALCSMGIYLFRTSILHEHLFTDAERDTSHDFGKDIIPSMISGGGVQNSVPSAGVRVKDRAEVVQSIIMENVVIDAHCRIRRAIIDKGVTIPPKTEIGYDLEADRKRFTVTESGIVVISKGMKLNA